MTALNTRAHRCCPASVIAHSIRCCEGVETDPWDHFRRLVGKTFEAIHHREPALLLDAAARHLFRRVVVFNDGKKIRIHGVK